MPTKKIAPKRKPVKRTTKVEPPIRRVQPRIRIVGTFSVERETDGSVLAVRDEKNIFATREQIITLISNLQQFSSDISDAEIDRVRAWDLVRQEAASKPTNKQREGPGFVYVMKLDKYYKIGISKDPIKRLHDIQCSLPLPILLVREIEVVNMRRVEKYLHDRFAPCWAAGEWFRLSPDDLQWIVANEERLSLMR